MASGRGPIAAALAVVLIGVAAHGPAPADGGGGCGRDGQKITWTGSALCHFHFRGLPVTVFGDALVSSGQASVRVWVTDGQAATSAPVLLECQDQDPGYTDCDGTLGGTGGLISCSPTNPNGVCADAGAWLHPLRCHVQGVGSGAFWCQSGDGR